MKKEKDVKTKNELSWRNKKDLRNKNDISLRNKKILCKRKKKVFDISEFIAPKLSLLFFFFFFKLKSFPSFQGDGCTVRKVRRRKHSSSWKYPQKLFSSVEDWRSDPSRVTPTRRSPALFSCTHDWYSHHYPGNVPEIVFQDTRQT